MEEKKRWMSSIFWKRRAKENEKELLNEMSLKKAVEASGCKSQELEANLVAMSEELKKKDDWAEELQRSSDIDLVQQMKQLRRTLDDAEGLSCDTKKEWAHLRSENISLKERDVSSTSVSVCSLYLNANCAQWIDHYRVALALTLCLGLAFMSH
ncbi:unnamed protein product [Oncorhynchus mykiss]|uniref:Uncharacterized protein n=1 Tax=Oncorhynchus mykiss TaxID=8022 RepID=A0A060VPH8_ONCMY|nr:unnamed protein product [Oncorhynchus mykiss]